MLSKRRILGLAVEGRSLTAVELTPLNGGAEARRAAEFVFPDGLDLHDAPRLGKALRQFLKDNGFGASRCVIGLEAHSLTARDKTLPPGVGGQVRQVLSLAVEREFASDLKDLVFDYSPAGDDGREATSALLVAAPRAAVEQLAAMAQAAGLRLEGVTASTLALAAGTDAAGGDTERLVLRVFRGGAELLTESATGARTMRPLPVAVAAEAGLANGWLERLIAELRRVVMLLPPPLPPGHQRELLIWNEAGLDAAARDILAERLALSVRVESVPKGIHANGLGTGPLPGQFCAASAVALAAVRGQALPVDFLHSRLIAARKPLMTRHIAWAAALAGVFLAAGALLLWDWRQDRKEIERLEGVSRKLEPQVVLANSVIDRTKFARPWHDKRPGYLACLKELTMAFPPEGRVWATHVTIKPEVQKVRGTTQVRETGRLRVDVTGSAENGKAALEVLDRLKDNKQLMSNVQWTGAYSSGKTAREESFGLSFSYGRSD
jgi:uncharacterized protein YggU (UPF0235/DUF167 family)